MQLKDTSVGLEAAAGGKMGKAVIEECWPQSFPLPEVETVSLPNWPVECRPQGAAERQPLGSRLPGYSLLARNVLWINQWQEEERFEEEEQKSELSWDLRRPVPWRQASMESNVYRKRKAGTNEGWKQVGISLRKEKKKRTLQSKKESQSRSSKVQDLQAGYNQGRTSLDDYPRCHL